MAEQCVQPDASTRYADGVYHKGLKRQLKVLIWVKEGKAQRVVCSTDVEMATDELVHAYKVRFHQGFMCRDAKQLFGLTHCQQRKTEQLEFHWNLSLSALTLAKMEMEQRWDEQGGAASERVYSMSEFKMSQFKQRVAQEIHQKFDGAFDDIDSLPSLSLPLAAYSDAA
jgi:hypothetical protein